jgi:hypothetical protein
MKINNLFKVTALSLFITGTAVSAKDKDIIDTAVGAGNFKTLATALKSAGLVDVLKGAGPFTVFAPTDKAFAKLPACNCDWASNYRVARVGFRIGRAR